MALEIPEIAFHFGTAKGRRRGAMKYKAVGSSVLHLRSWLGFEPSFAAFAISRAIAVFEGMFRARKEHVSV